MKRLVALTAVVVAVGAFVVWKMRDARLAAAVGPVTADSVWYHASDVALLAKTGRPQLVEFFHPS